MAARAFETVMNRREFNPRGVNILFLAPLITLSVETSTGVNSRGKYQGTLPSSGKVKDGLKYLLNSPRHMIVSALIRAPSFFSYQSVPITLLNLSFYMSKSPTLIHHVDRRYC